MCMFCYAHWLIRNKARKCFRFARSAETNPCSYILNFILYQKYFTGFSKISYILSLKYVIELPNEVAALKPPILKENSQSMIIV